ncbi:MAG: hypothetical protein R2724_27675 [Bryobacterales bacterium]
MPAASYRRLWIVLGILLPIALVAAYYGALNRPPWPDEGWFSSAAYNMAYHGYMGTTVYHPAGNGLALTRIDEHTYWIMPGFLVGQALWLVVFPATLASIRLFSIAWLPVLVGALYVYLRSLFPRGAVPLVGAILLAGNYMAIDTAIYARPETMCAALGVSGLAAYAWLRERNLPLALAASNLLVAMSGLTHPNGIFHFVALMALIAWFDLRRLHFRDVAAAGAPYLALALVWYAYIAQDSQAFVDQMSVNGSQDRWPDTLNPLRILWNELSVRYLTAYGFVTGGMNRIKALSLLLMWGSVAGCLAVPELRRISAVRLLLLQLGLYFAGMCVFNQKLTYYLIHIVPAYIAVAAVFLVWLSERGRLWRTAATAAVAGLICIEIAGVFLKARTRSYIEDQEKVVEYVKTHMTPDSNVNGTSGFLFAFDFDPRFQDDAYLGVDTGRRPDFIIVEQFYQGLYDGWKTRRPEAMARIQERLAEYEVGFELDGYKVYVRKP